MQYEAKKVRLQFTIDFNEEGKSS